ncbi:MAG: hypothetical protein RJA79_1468, partial [Actinomycetota bacterium]
MTATENITPSQVGDITAAGTNEGRQELQLRKDVSAKEILRGSGA